MLIVDPKMPAFMPRSTSLQVVLPGQHNGRVLAQDFGGLVVYNDDLAQLWFGTGPPRPEAAPLIIRPIFPR